MTDYAEQLDLAPELRMTSYAYREEFGRRPATVWRVPGTVTLLTDGDQRLTVATPWGAIAAAGPADGDVVELVQMERPGERRSRPGTGATVLVSSELPEGTGTGSAAATEEVIQLCTGSAPATALPGGPHVRAGNRWLPFDLAAAGLRLMVIDTRVRDAPRSAPAEHSPVGAAVTAISSGDLAALGPMLTAAHNALDHDFVQQVAVSVALRARALGARAIFDGAGRPVVVLVPAGRLADVRAAVTAEFGRHRLRLPRFLTFTPAAGPWSTGAASPAPDPVSPPCP
ncbi:MAG: hypothetical protein ABSA93_14710 [Streptosporangiaceae bacterium]